MVVDTTKKLEGVIDDLTSKAEEEDEFLQAAENGEVSTHKLETNFEDFIIFLDKDIEGKLKEV